MEATNIIRWRTASAGFPGFELYEDAVEALTRDDAPVYLRFDCVQIEMKTTVGGATVTAALPREMAQAMGLLPEPSPKRRR